MKILIDKNLFYFAILSCFQLFSCSPKHERANRIAAKELTFLLEKNTPSPISQLVDFNCKEPIEVDNRNLDYSYHEAILVLKEKFQAIDTLLISADAKQYAKSLIVADFVYATFSYQFLGPNLGIANDTMLAISWDTLPLSICYNIGNYNQASVYCAERTNFYLRLVDTLLNIKGREVFVQDIHTFPVLEIGKGSFIVDPYDPFVIVDSSETWLVDYQSLIDGFEKNYFKPKRTARMFGGSRQLLSLPFINMLKQTFPDTDCICCLVKMYLEKNKKYLHTFVRPCFDINLLVVQNVQKLTNNRYPYSLGMSGRVDGNLTTHLDVVRYYVGIDCK